MLDFDSATKRFGTVPALDGCSFTARPGRLTGFLGPNGAGKTTAMRAVFGLVELDSGIVRWRGQDVGHAERARFGYMPEERGLYPRMRVHDQLMYLAELDGHPSREAGRRVDTWLDRFGLAGRGRDPLAKLSHGNQQRIQLIAALLNDPELLVLDEPFSGLDPIAMDAMAELLREVSRQGATVLFSSHQLDLVEHLCEDVVIIERGRVVLAGDLDDLRAAVPERLVNIRFTGVTPDWSRVDSVEVLDTAAGRARLRVHPGTDLTALIGLVRDRSELVSFEYQAPSLSELFREAVTT